MSPSLGLAVDSVLSIEVVTMNGTIFTATARNNTDLFFALRGGGGGTFGIVTSITLKLHEAPGQVVGLDMILPIDQARDFFTAYIAMQPKMHQCWGGYILTGACVVGVPATTPAKVQLHLMCNAGMAIANASIAPLKTWFDAAKQKAPLADKAWMIWILKEHLQFWDWHGNAIDAVGGNTQIASHIMPVENFEDKAKSIAMRDTILKYAAEPLDGAGLYIIQLGGVVATADPTASAAISKGYRNGQWHIVHGVQFSSQGNESLAAFKNELLAQAPHGGAYFNEMYYYEPNWAQSFFGDNYDRLMKIKQTYDPSGRLNCHQCVGSTNTPAPVPPPSPPSPPPAPPSPPPSPPSPPSPPAPAPGGRYVCTPYPHGPNAQCIESAVGVYSYELCSAICGGSAPPAPPPPTPPPPHAPLSSECIGAMEKTCGKYKKGNCTAPCKLPKTCNNCVEHHPIQLKKLCGGTLKPTDRFQRWCLGEDPNVGPSPGPSPPAGKCDICDTGVCAACKPCANIKAGPCAPCWAKQTNGTACCPDCARCWKSTNLQPLIV